MTTPHDDPSRRLADLGRWIKRNRVPLAVSSAAVSLLVHLVVLLIAALIVLGKPPGQIGGDAREVEFAVMTDAELAEIARADMELDVEQDAQSAAALELSTELELEALEIDPSQLTESIGEVSLQLGGGEVEGMGLGVGEIAGAGASFFGVEASGNRFAFVVDVSGSMRLDGRLEGMKQELSRAISALFTSSSFFVTFFSGAAAPLGDRGVTWMDATDSGKAWARGHIVRTAANGPTNPLPAFTLLRALDKRPDAVYFMTDGEFPAQEANEIIRIAHTLETPVHCITFGSREGEQVMRHIASSTRGTYTHIEGPGG